MKAYFTIFLFFYFFSNLQASTEKYWLYFTDKNESQEMLSQPRLFLSEKAIERRRLQNISITQSDLPVSTEYLEEITAYKVEIVSVSRWMNAVTVRTEASEIKLLEQLPFVKKITPVRKMQNVTRSILLPNDPLPEKSLGDESYYGLGFGQIAMVKGDLLHDMGYKGEGMVIAVLDAGYNHTNLHPGFTSLFASGQILGTRDFVNPEGGEVQYDQSSHGTSVLSVMAANDPGVMVGTAPEASYWLFRTEASNTETLVEEDYWLAAAEYADEVGADIINSSLGYTVFDEAIGDHTYLDMDGNTTIITMAADMAASKGILVVNSVGNLGDDEWYYMSAPADGDSVLAVGSVDALQQSSGFSSHGPTVDYRVKPNVCAQGQGTIVANVDGGYLNSNGTSFSAPLIAGMAACMWEYWREIDPSFSNMELIELMESRSSLYPFSNADLGYGVPDFEKIVWGLDIEENDNNSLVDVYPNPFSNRIHIKFNEYSETQYTYHLRNAVGVEYLIGEMLGNEKEIVLPTALASGIYFLELKSDKNRKVIKLVH